MEREKFFVSASPHIHEGSSTQGLMIHVPVSYTHLTAESVTRKGMLRPPEKRAAMACGPRKIYTYSIAYPAGKVQGARGGPAVKF